MNKTSIIKKSNEFFTKSVGKQLRTKKSTKLYTLTNDIWVIFVNIFLFFLQA